MIGLGGDRSYFRERCRGYRRGDGVSRDEGKGGEIEWIVLR